MCCGGVCVCVCLLEMVTTRGRMGRQTGKAEWRKKGGLTGGVCGTESSRATLHQGFITPERENRVNSKGNGLHGPVVFAHFLDKYLEI